MLFFCVFSSGLLTPDLKNNLYRQPESKLARTLVSAPALLVELLVLFSASPVFMPIPRYRTAALSVKYYCPAVAPRVPVLYLLVGLANLFVSHT